MLKLCFVLLAILGVAGVATPAALFFFATETFNAMGALGSATCVLGGFAVALMAICVLFNWED